RKGREVFCPNRMPAEKERPALGSGKDAHIRDMLKRGPVEQNYRNALPCWAWLCIEPCIFPAGSVQIKNPLRPLRLVW
ncbi:MAG: hypothetical protein ABIK98_14670, partial [Pseudomonadota bacterium]